jgi:two-component system sensor histidine kinase NblS
VRDNVVSLIEENKSEEIIPFCERFYKNSTSLRYIIFIDSKGVSYGIPYNYSEVLSRTLRAETFSTPNTKVMRLSNEKFLGFLIVGNTFNLPLSNNNLIKNEFILIIILIFVFAILLGTLFVKLTITRPLNEVSQGLVSIATGNFSRRINLRFGGDLGDLVNSFNELGRRLELYEEKNSEQLFSEKIKLESLVTTITDGALLLDTNLRILLVNTTAIKIFGWKTKKKLLGTSIWEHLPSVLQKKFFVTLQDILFTEQSAMFDGQIEDDMSQFSKRSIRMILNIVYDSQDVNKLPIGIGVTIQDMTKAFELDKKQNRFMSNISHELRTPLFNIKSFIETLQEYEYTISSWQKRYFLDIVIKETNRLTRLVNDILSLSKLDTLKDVPLGSMNLVETIHQTTANYQIIARDQNLVLHSRMHSRNLNIRGNKDLLFQVLINLVGNALKFTHKEGEIVLRAYEITNQIIRVEIVDTGVGILYGYQQDIFQRFYRIENEIHTLKGTGLGLSIVDTILSEHKTEIHVVSRYSVGSAFWFDLRKSC